MRSLSNKKKLFLVALPLLVFAVIIGVLVKGLCQDPREIPSPLVGKPVPVMQAEALESHQPLSEKDFFGHLTLLNVFASWCESCRAEQSVLLSIADQKLVRLVGLNYKDQQLQVKKWLKANGNPYQQIIYDPTGKIAMNLGVYGTPETFLIDPQGIIRYKYVGPISPDAWQDNILPQIKKIISSSR